MRPVDLAILLGFFVSGCVNATSQTPGNGGAELTQIVKDRVPGTPVRCISTRQIRATHVVDRTAIIYEFSRHLLYVNQPRWGAEALARDSVLLSRTSLPSLCNGEIIHLLDSSLNERGAIALSEFVPYRTERSTQLQSGVQTDPQSHVTRNLAP